MENDATTRIFSIRNIRKYNTKTDQFKITKGLSKRPKDGWYSRTELLDSYPGLLELDEFLHPNNHQLPKKEPIIISDSKSLTNNCTSSVDQGSKENSTNITDSKDDAVVQKNTREFTVSRFNLDPKLQVFCQKISKPKEKNTIDIVEGCSIYSKSLELIPFSLGESNLVQAALDEGLMGQALQLAAFFSSSCKMYPEPERTFDMLVKCIELARKHFVKGDKNCSPLKSNETLQSPLSQNSTRSRGSSCGSQDSVPSRSSQIELGKTLTAMARLLENLKSYLEPPYFYEMLRPLFEPSQIIDGRPLKTYLIKLDLWQWVEWLGKLQSGGLNVPSILAISSGQLLAVIVSILHDDTKFHGLPNLDASILVRLLPGSDMSQCHKLEPLLEGFQSCDFSNASGQAWITSMFHLHHLIVLLSHANIVSDYTLLHLTHAHYQKNSALSKRRFLQSVVSLPFQCRLIDFILKDVFSPLYKDDQDMGWFRWTRLRNVYLKVPYKEVLAILMKKIAPHIKIQLEVRVTRATRQLDSETALSVHQELVHHFFLLHTLIFSYLFFRSKTHHPLEDSAHSQNSQTKNSMAEWRSSLLELGNSLEPVERFLSVGLKNSPSLVSQFNVLLLDFPFPAGVMEPIVIE